MNDLTKSPFLVLTLSFVVMSISARIGFFCRKRHPKFEADKIQDLDLIVTATLTLLSLIIGFSFSMAITRYDQRKNYEAEEANAIGTEYVRADLLPPTNAARARVLLRDYLDQRVLFYTTRDEHLLQQVNAHTAQLQNELWSAVQAPAVGQPTPVLALAVSGMNDVLNSEGYTQAAWLNRIPIAAWGLMAIVAVCSHILVGYTARSAAASLGRLLVLPIVLCIAFSAIADIDAPRTGVIRVTPQNLVSLARALHGH